MEIEYHIFPFVKQGVAKIATAARFSLAAAAVCSVACTLCWALGSGVGVLFYCLTELMMAAELLLLSILAPWCHTVLLAGRGLTLTRALSYFCTAMGLIMLVCEAYYIITGTLLMPRQGETPYFIITALLLCTLFNLPNMAAAPLRWRITLPLFLLFLLFSIITSGIFVGVLPFLSATSLAVSALLGYPHLRRLAATAPLIISMPPRQ